MRTPLLESLFNILAGLTFFEEHLRTTASVNSKAKSNHWKTCFQLCDLTVREFPR